MKQKVFSILFLLFFFTGCTSIQNVYTISADYGQLYFVRSTYVDKTPEAVKSFDFDITVRTDNEGVFISDPVVNYSFVCDKTDYSVYEKIDFYFLCNGIRIEPVDVIQIYKEIGESKNLTVRYTSSIKCEDFVSLLQADSDVLICLESSDELITQSSKAFNEKLLEMKVLLK